MTNNEPVTGECVGCGADVPKGDEWCSQCVRDSSNCKACMSGADCAEH